MNSKVLEFIRCCLVCQKTKGYRGMFSYSYPLDSGEAAKVKFGHVAVDFFGALALPKCSGCTAVLSIGYNTRFVKFHPIKSKKSVELWRILKNEWSSNFGFPCKITSDNAKELIFGVCKTEMKKRGIKSKLSGLFSHEQNGIVEKSHRWLKEHLLIFMITKEKESLKGCSDVVHDISARWNASFNKSLQETPQFLVFNQDDVSPRDFKKDNVKRKESWEQTRLKKLKESIKGCRFTKTEDFVPGEIVLIQWPQKNKNSIFCCTEGPCRIESISGDTNAIVYNLSSKIKMNVDVRMLRIVIRKREI